MKLALIFLVLIMHARSNEVLLALRLHLERENSTIRKEVNRDLNYSTQMDTVQCNQTSLCSKNNCDMVQKTQTIVKEVKRRLEKNESKANWTCVDSENLDGVCQNGLMEKAVLKNRTIMKPVNEAVCNSEQEVKLQLQSVRNVSITTGTGVLNNYCHSVELESRWSCDEMQKTAIATINAVVGGKSDQFDVKITWSWNTEVLKKGGNDIVVKGESLNLQSTELLSDTSSGVDIYSDSFNDIAEYANKLSQETASQMFKNLTKQDFLNDTVHMQENDSMSRMSRNFKLDDMECSTNPLCKSVVCKQVVVNEYKYKADRKWFGDPSYFDRYADRVNFKTVAEREGYTCYQTFYHGCYASKRIKTIVSSKKVMNESCYENVKTKITVQPRSTIKVDIDSLFDQCKVEDGQVSCKVDTQIEYNMVVEAVGTETVKVVSHGSTTYQAAIQNKQLKLNASSVEYLQKYRVMNAQLTAGYFSQGSDVSHQILEALQKYANSVLPQIISSNLNKMSNNHYLPKKVDDKSTIDNAKKVSVSFGFEKCENNDLCAQNCKLVAQKEQYSENMTKVVHRDNQTRHENEGWTCQTVLNNVTNCINDLYKRNETVSKVTKHQMNPEVCNSMVTPEIELVRLESVETSLEKLADNCHETSINDTQKLMCKNLNATAIWTISASAGGNTNATDLRTIFNMDLVFDIQHSLNKKGNRQARFNILQTEGDFGDIKTTPESPFAFKILQNEEWFKDMVNIVRKQVKDVVFSGMLDTKSIKNGFLQLGS